MAWSPGGAETAADEGHDVVVKRNGLAKRLVLVSVVAAAGLGVSPAPASAQVLVGADNPSSGATNVQVSFRAQALSRVSGIAFLRVTLSAGLDASDFRLVSAPQGWNLSSTADGYNVGGPPLDVGQDARYTVVVDRLPNVRQLPFRTLQQYSDGRIEDDNATPVLTLAQRQQQPPPRVEQPQRPPQRVEPPRVEQPPVPPPVKPPVVIPTPPPTFDLPTFDPPATISPTADAVALASNDSRPGSWLWISLGAAVLLGAPVAWLAWSGRRRGRRRHRRISV